MRVKGSDSWWLLEPRPSSLGLASRLSLLGPGGGAGFEEEEEGEEEEAAGAVLLRNRSMAASRTDSAWRMRAPFAVIWSRSHCCAGSDSSPSTATQTAR